MQHKQLSAVTPGARAYPSWERPFRCQSCLTTQVCDGPPGPESGSPSLRSRNNDGSTIAKVRHLGLHCSFDLITIDCRHCGIPGNSVASFILAQFISFAPGNGLPAKRPPPASDGDGSRKPRHSGRLHAGPSSRNIRSICTVVSVTAFIIPINSREFLLG